MADKVRAQPARLSRATAAGWLGAGLLACAVAASGCDQRVEPWIPPDQEPPPPERPVRIPGLGSPTPRAALAPTAPAARPGSESGARAGTAPSAPPASGPPVRGRITVAPGTPLPPNAILFVIARAPSGGPPLAVKRLTDVRFPLEFSIGAEDAMIAARPFAGPVLLSARLDADGDPLTNLASDPKAALSEAIEPGTRGVELVLSTE